MSSLTHQGRIKDLRGEANHSSGSVKQEVWGTQPPRSYRILFCEAQKCHLMQDLENLIQVLKFCENNLTKVVSWVVVDASLWKV